MYMHMCSLMILASYFYLYLRKMFKFIIDILLQYTMLYTWLFDLYKKGVENFKNKMEKNALFMINIKLDILILVHNNSLHLQFTEPYTCTPTFKYPHILKRKHGFIYKYMESKKVIHRKHGYASTSR